MGETWTPKRLIAWSEDYFHSKGILSPRLDAELLLSATLQCERIELYLNHDKPLSQDELKQYRSFVERRAAREPLQYILGEAEFYGLKFKVTPDVLIPRPETEQLIEKVLSKITGKDHDGADPVSILDIGTGSGCIAITLAKHLPTATITATDISPAALEIAQHNASTHGVSNRVTFIETDLFPLEDELYDLIVSNPPYIETEAINSLQSEVAEWEPHSALDGGSNGLDIYRRLIITLEKRLAPGGFFVGEIGMTQSDILKKYVQEQQVLEWVDVFKDLLDRDRVVVIQKIS